MRSAPAYRPVWIAAAALAASLAAAAPASAQDAKPGDDGAELIEPDKAVDAMEIIIDRRQPSSGLYVQLASLAYQAGETRKAELSSKKALELAPKDDKEQVKAALDSARQAASATVSSATPSSTATPSS